MIAFIESAQASILLNRLILLFILSISNTVWGVNSIAIIDDSHDVSNISQTGSYFIDKNKALSLDDISSDEYAKQFRPINSDYFQLGMVEGNVWIRTDVAIRTIDNTPVLLEINSPRLQYLDIYLPTLHKGQVQVEIGGARPYNNRQVKSPHYIFSIPANPPPVFTLYLKLSSHLPINADIELKTLSRISQDTQQELTITGILIGILFTLFVCNIFFYIKTSHPMYLIYSFLLVGIVILHLSIHDQVAQFFPNQSNIQERLYNLSSLACLCAIVFFSRLYLNTKAHLPNIDKILIAVGSINGIFAIIFSLTPNVLNIKVLSLIVVSTLILLTIHAIIAFLKNIPFSGYYLAARLTLLTGHFLWILSVYSIIPSVVLFEWGLTITIILEAMIHFSGMIVQTSPLIQKNTLKSQYNQTEVMDFLSDISNRLRRQINILGGGLSHLEQVTTSKEVKPFITSSQTANNNLKNIIERIDLLSDIKDNTPPEQPYPQPLNQLIDRIYNNLQRLDQDNTLIELNTHNTDHVEVLQNATILQHLIESLVQEFKHFTDQTLTLDISRHESNRDGITQLEISCGPIPSRIQASSSFDLGMHYILLLIRYLDGEMKTLESERCINIKLPISVHIRPTNNDLAQQQHFNIILFGQPDEDLQKALSILQSHSNRIEHVSTLENLLEHLELPEKRKSGSIILVFDNGGHIPHVTQQRLMPLMRIEDQCLLISNNVKMSLDYTRKLGFDGLLTCAELDSQLEQQLSKLIQKGDRLKNTSLSRINPLRKTP
ncbi:sensor histidine kinase [Marinomonas foliarum]|uniref:7TMR-DISM extracellular protein 2 n=1 Tax=Marinomonas foliarum TaxID=491950 RepID=A0A369A7N1_9GAMM|nr:7TM diverse intracellular signaling domain-containing protein [Marinomonas foliarum]RCX03444.1 7TMR-DISM extracellular protein 2 [Marinomonas foliarum]